MARTYNNPWIPDEALRILNEESGTILDVGGSAPYVGATHILDIQEFSAEHLRDNAWGGGGVREWTKEQYTRFDLCGGERWPFDDDQFDLGLCSHTLESLRDPLPAVKELCRVARKILIICPSRLLEQTRGVDHPRYCGFSHHLWIVFEQNGLLVFRPKTPVLEMPGCHLICPLGKTLLKGEGCMFYYGDNVRAEVRIFPALLEEYEDYRKFIEPYRGRKDIFVVDQYTHNLKYWIWRLRQKYLGRL